MELSLVMIGGKDKAVAKNKSQGKNLLEGEYANFLKYLTQGNKPHLLSPSL